MKQAQELLKTGVYESFSPEKKMTVKALLKELNLEGKYFGILINGKKATEDTTIDKTDSVVILPHIAGGV